MEKQFASLRRVKALISNLFNLPKPSNQKSKTNNQKEGERTMKPQILIALRQAALLTVLLTILAVPNWSQGENLNQGQLGDPLEYETDELASICSNASLIRISRAENGQYYAVVIRDPDATHPSVWFQVYKNIREPSYGNWQLVFSKSTPVREADIEIVSSNDKGYILYIEDYSDHPIRCLRFSLSNPADQLVTDVETFATDNRANCSLTSDEVDHDGAEVYLYACWENQWATNKYIEFKRNQYQGSGLWQYQKILANGVLYAMPGGNSIAYSPLYDRVLICWGDENMDIRVSSSSTRGTGVWVTPTAIMSGTSDIYPAGITSMYGGYVLVTATQSGNVMYAYHTRSGLTSYSWSVRTFTWSGSQVAYSCASNNDGYFSILYYNQYEKDTGVGTDRLESKRCYYGALGSTSFSYWNTLKVAEASLGETIDPNACIEDGIYPTHNPDHGGVWAERPEFSTSYAYFGWGEDNPVSISIIPQYVPIVIPGTGGNFRYQLLIRNTGTTPQSGFYWCDYTNPSGVNGEIKVGPTLFTAIPAGGQRIIPSVTVQVQPIASPGTWEWNAYAGPNPGYGSTSKDFIFFVKTSGEDGGDLGGPCADPITSLNEFNQHVANGSVQKTENALDFALLGASPNPFNPATTIKFQMPQAGLVNLKVYGTAGRLVTTLVNGMREAGAHDVTFDGSNLSSGVYLYSLTAGAYSATGKMVLVK